MLRNDGNYTFYQIRAQYTNKNHKQDWFLHSDYYQPDIKKQRHKKNCRPDCFTASGECWQQTGQFGVYNIKYAIEGLAKAKKDYASNLKAKKIDKGYEVRLCIFEVTIWQSKKLINL